MKELEFQAISSPEEIDAFLDSLEASIRARMDPEAKYSFQVGLKDVEFDVNEERARALGLTLPMGSIAEAEQALRAGVITPTGFLEEDNTNHQVLGFDPTPVGFSGFDNCVIHSLAQTDLGLFEVGRYPAVDLQSRGKTWQWFIHRKVGPPQDPAEYVRVQSSI
jgi:hypothetical protein